MAPGREATVVESFYRDLIHNLDAIIWETNPETNQFTFVNQHAEEILGYPVERWLAGDWFAFWSSLIHPEDRERTVQYSQLELNAGRDHKLEYRALAADGRIVWVHGMVYLQRDVMGQVRQVRGLMVDVSERKRMEAALRSSEEKYRHLFNYATMGIYQTAPDGTILTANHSLARMLGYESPDDLLGRNIGEEVYYHKGERAALIAQYEPSTTAVEVEVRWQKRDGTPIWVHLNIHVVRDAHQQALHYDGFVLDITARQQSEEALRRSEQYFRALIENASDLISIFDSRGTFLYASQSHKTVLGYEPHELINQPVADYVHPHDLPAMTEAFAASLAQPGVPVEFEFRARHKDGNWHTLEGVNQNLLHDPAVTGIVANARDVTERKSAAAALKASEESYRELFENAHDIHYTHDLAGNFITVNKAGELVTGYTRDELLQMNVTHLVTSEHLDLARRIFMDQLTGKGPHVYEIEIVTKHGRRIPLEVSIRLMYETGRRIGVQGLARDIKERCAAQAALKESEERYALAALGANDGLWDWDFKNHQIYFSPRWKSMLGYDSGEIGHRPEEWFALIHPDDAGKVKEQLYEHLEGRSNHFQNEHRVLHKDGQYRWMLARGIAIHDAAGAVTRIAGSQTDITRGKQVEEQLIHEAFHDVLTGLPNRALFMDHLALVIEQSTRRQDYRFAVLFLDLDHFKIVNDSLGHLAGDSLLQEISRRLKSCLRPGDTVARLGGDEFTILLQDITDARDAEQVAERIHKELMLPFNIDGIEIFTTASLGIALQAKGFNRAEDFLRAADTAMYRAKARGRARHEVFDQVMHAEVKTRLQLETDLHRAVKRAELRVHYQPIISVETGSIIGFEALVRWHHPVRGLVSPVNFIPLAEETGLIIPIGLWVLEEACRQTKIWQAQFLPTLSISVNLSSKQFTQFDLIPRISCVLRDSGFEPRHLSLEITESVVMEHAESTSLMLQQLRSLGVQLTIDDFGTGYSSLSYLQRFPIDTLKVDRSFISRMGERDDSSEIVRTIITMARNLRLDVVAEGVETPEQLTQLKSLNCGYVQGNYFSAALNADAAERFLSLHPGVVAHKQREASGGLMQKT